MKGCKGICDEVGTTRPFGRPYETHVLCRRCSAWLLKSDLNSDLKCPCCKQRTKHKPSKRRICLT